MAVLAMKRISICGLKQDRKAIMEKIQRKGVIEVQDFVAEDEVFSKQTMPISNSEFERNIHDAEAAIEILNTYNLEKSGLLSSFKGRDVIDVEKYDGFKKEYTRVSSAVSKLLALAKDVAEKKAEIVKDKQQIEMLKPWETLDIPFNFQGTEKTAAFIGALPGEWTLDAIYEGLAQCLPVDVNVISTTKNQTCIFVVSHKDNKENVNATLRGMGFSYPSVDISVAPSEGKTLLLADIEKLEKEIAGLEDQIKSYEDQRADIKFMADYQAIRAEKYAVTNSLPQSEHTFIISGYIPEIYIKDIEEILKDYAVTIDTEDVLEDEDAPVMLKNNAFSSSVQGVVESYALPSKGEVDPSFLISLFYFVFFGFMLADAAIGLLIVIGAGALLIMNKNMEKGLKNNVKLFLFGGISATIFGVLFGSYFGDVITSVSSNFFGNGIVVKPLWLDMTANPMTVLTLALCMGLIHIFTGMGVGAYQFIKKKDYMSLIFGVLVWYVILIGLIVKCLSMQMIMDILLGGREPLLSAQVGTVGLIAAGVGALVVIVMGEFNTKSWPKRLLKGAYAVYGITGYLSDVLSYSRLLALGLATGVISSVANMIGTMFGSGVLGVIIFALVFLIINAINIGINTLGAYVHTNRLQYVEFFSRFYEGGGRPFEPYSIKTKYYKFKEN